MDVSSTPMKSSADKAIVNNEDAESFSVTLSFGILGLVVAVISISIAVLQLRRMSHRTKTVVFELACKTSIYRVGRRKFDHYLGRAHDGAKLGYLGSKCLLSSQAG
jgi:hypothetical protein